MHPILAKLDARTANADSLLCVGLDPDLDKMPAAFRAGPDALFRFCAHIADETAAYAAAFKPNAAFFEALGSSGARQLELLFDHLRAHHPNVVTILDAKRGDIGNTNAGYAAAAFDLLGADAVTLHPYLGSEALKPFLERTDRMSIVLCRTSNPGAGELQDMVVHGATRASLQDGLPEEEGPPQPLWERVAEVVARDWNTHGQCALVVGATWPEEMRRIRTVAPALPFLVPGIGAQGGDVEATLEAGLDARGRGLLLSSSRAILYADDPAKAAAETVGQMRRARLSLRENGNREGRA